MAGRCCDLRLLLSWRQRMRCLHGNNKERDSRRWKSLSTGFPCHFPFSPLNAFLFKVTMNRFPQANPSDGKTPPGDASSPFPPLSTTDQKEPGRNVERKRECGRVANLLEWVGGGTYAVLVYAVSRLLAFGVFFSIHGAWISKEVSISDETSLVSALSACLVGISVFEYAARVERIFDGATLLLEIGFPGIQRQLEATARSLRMRLWWRRLFPLMEVVFYQLCVLEASLRWRPSTKLCMFSRQKDCELRWSERLVADAVEGVCGHSHLPVGTCERILSRVPLAVEALCVYVGGAYLPPLLNRLLLRVVLRRTRSSGEPTAADLEEQIPSGAVEDCRGIGVPWAMLLISAIQALAFYLGGDSLVDLLLWDPKRCHQLWRFLTVSLTHANSLHLWGNVSGQLFFSVLLHAVFPWRSLVGIYFFGVFAGSAFIGILIPQGMAVGASGGGFALFSAFIGSIFAAILSCTWRLVPTASKAQWRRVGAFYRRISFTPPALCIFVAAVLAALAVDPPPSLWSRVMSAMANWIAAATRWWTPPQVAPEFTLLEREAGHLGGAVGGAILTGLLLLRMEPPSAERLWNQVRVSIGVFDGLACVLYYLVFLRARI